MTEPRKGTREHQLLVLIERAEKTIVDLEGNAAFMAEIHKAEVDAQKAEAFYVRMREEAVDLYNQIGVEKNLLVARAGMRVSEGEPGDVYKHSRELLAKLLERVGWAGEDPGELPKDQWHDPLCKTAEVVVLRIVNADPRYQRAEARRKQALDARNTASMNLHRARTKLDNEQYTLHTLERELRYVREKKNKRQEKKQEQAADASAANKRQLRLRQARTRLKSIENGTITLYWP